MSINTIFILMIWIQVKHFIADYLLQNEYMLGKFKNTNWVLPLIAHCFVHFVFTFLLTLIVTTDTLLAFQLGFLDMTIHFIMDRVKASPNLLGKYTALSKNEMINLLKEEQECNKIVMPTAYTVRPEIIEKLSEIDRKKQSNVYFWWALGYDQMIHHITDVIIIYLMVISYGI